MEHCLDYIEIDIKFFAHNQSLRFEMVTKAEFEAAITGLLFSRKKC